LGEVYSAGEGARRASGSQRPTLYTLCLPQLLAVTRCPASSPASRWLAYASHGGYQTHKARAKVRAIKSFRRSCGTGKKKWSVNWFSLNVCRAPEYIPPLYPSPTQETACLGRASPLYVYSQALLSLSALPPLRLACHLPSSPYSIALWFS